MRIMGLDVGEKRIGVAISDPLGWTAQGHSVVQRSTLKNDLAKLKELCQQLECQLVVVGLPRNMNGTLGPKAEEIQEFVRHLHDVVSVPIEYWDERLTTRSAERVLLEADLSRRKRRKVIDKVAAVHILQNYLDAHKS
ncbi:MAG: Holliday junction resolvase RuvX [Syntrophomonadaceae bacterium]|jgi:putative Holliday junction resolvase|nr:Holliday junction resolvase RuvX [Bacillota bacterium]NLM87798.1 Holliday junction resolvase RuvX [Syntrophomonadaceae bacterium]HAA09575.1 Holliday junction resolvase RuvX [Syntrophomonas sp.]HQA49449.1 Holliday junction resolvase RuvX [Syntrophomonadaceae bacterium]HQD90751.1 Holliday junction resolvase RuvX [Syntrophomonadaceae bacterium]